MKTLDALLVAFEQLVLPHERYFIAQGFVTQAWRAEEYSAFEGAVHEMNGAFADRRVRAHRSVLTAFGSLGRRYHAHEIEPEILGRLVAWAMEELALNTFSSFASFALLLRSLGGDKALPFAPQIFVAAVLSPQKFRPALLDEAAQADMALLMAALEAEAIPASALPSDRPLEAGYWPSAHRHGASGLPAYQAPSAW